MSTVLAARDLARWYGQVVGLNDLSAEIGPGITGLIGPNGAGKSTFLKLIAGEIRPSRGTVRVLGQDPFANRALHRQVGFCPQQDALYDDLTGFEIVRFLLELSGFGKQESTDRARRTLERLDLGDVMDRSVGGYSKGMRQRVKVAQAIAHDPQLLVLDEPLTGLDPIGRRDMIELLRELGAGGTHVLLSSHVLHEVESLTEDILLLHRGRLLAQGSVPEVRELLAHHPRRIELEAERSRELATALMACEEVLAVRLVGTGGTLSLETRDLGSFHRSLTRIAGEGGYGVRSLESVDASLEAIFDYLIT